MTTSRASLPLRSKVWKIRGSVPYISHRCTKASPPEVMTTLGELSLSGSRARAAIAEFSWAVRCKVHRNWHEDMDRRLRRSEYPHLLRIGPRPSSNLSIGITTEYRRLAIPVFEHLDFCDLSCMSSEGRKGSTTVLCLLKWVFSQWSGRDRDIVITSVSQRATVFPAPKAKSPSEEQPEHEADLFAPTEIYSVSTLIPSTCF